MFTRILILLTMFSSCLAFAQDYYYMGNTKRPLYRSEKFILAHVAAPDRANIRNSSAAAGFIHRQDVRAERGIYLLEKQGLVTMNDCRAQLARKVQLIRTYPVFSPDINQSDAKELIFDEINVAFSREITDSQLNDLLLKWQISVVSKNEFGEYLFRLNDNSKWNTLEVANGIFESGIVKYSEPNFIEEVSLCTDPFYPNQWWLNNTGQLGWGAPANVDINAPEAWDERASSPNIKVAVIDDGVEDHEDFYSGQILPGFTASGASGPGNGRPDDGQAHGECVAGIIGANHNTLDARGVAPGVKILPINIFSSNLTVSMSEIAHMFDSARVHGADVINNSWAMVHEPSDYEGDAAVNAAMDRAMTLGRGGKGCVIVGAAGNIPEGCYQQVLWPAKYPGVLAVGAVGFRNQKAPYSPTSPRVDVVAPSSNSKIESPCGTTEYLQNLGSADTAIATLDRMGVKGYSSGNYYLGFGGTSAAAPQASAIGAYVLSIDPTLSGSDVCDVIKNSADDYGSTSWDGHGRIDALSAILMITAKRAIQNDANEIPVRTKLFQNYPNPFNPTTVLSFDVPEDAFVSLAVFNVSGQKVQTVVEEKRSRGFYNVLFNGTGLPSGIYYYRLAIGNFIETKKMALLK